MIPCNSIIVVSERPSRNMCLNDAARSSAWYPGFSELFFFRIEGTRYQSPISVREIATIDNLNEEREGTRYSILRCKVTVAWPAHSSSSSSSSSSTSMWRDYPRRYRFLLYRLRVSWRRIEVRNSNERDEVPLIRVTFFYPLIGYSNGIFTFFDDIST